MGDGIHVYFMYTLKGADYDADHYWYLHKL
jgi:hypothetical protein